MNMNLEKPDNPEEKDPTSQDLQDLKIKIASVVSGDIIHEIKNIQTGLDLAMQLITKKGCTQDLKTHWYKQVKRINAIVMRDRLSQAKDKGLL